MYVGNKLKKHVWYYQEIQVMVSLANAKGYLL